MKWNEFTPLGVFGQSYNTLGTQTYLVHCTQTLHSLNHIFVLFKNFKMSSIFIVCKEVTLNISDPNITRLILENAGHSQSLCSGVSSSSRQDRHIESVFNPILTRCFPLGLCPVKVPIKVLQSSLFNFKIKSAIFLLGSLIKSLECLHLFNTFHLWACRTSIIWLIQPDM